MKKIALVGMPNTGKSTLFNRLTGAHAKVGNWPGITVDLLSARLILGGDLVQLIDLPGIYDLCGHAEDEKVVTTFLKHQRPDLIIMVISATQLERQARLWADLKAQGLPMAIVVTMADEAQKLGIGIDVAGLGQRVGVPVCLLSAKYGQGMEQLQGLLSRTLRQAPGPSPNEDPAQAWHAAMRLHVQTPAQAPAALTQTLDRLFLHPWWGLPLFLLMMFLVFQAVFTLGKPLQDGMAWLFDWVRTGWLEPTMAAWPDALRGLLLDGVYSGVATVAGFVPLIVLFFVFMSMVEDTGYLSRAAFLMDALMAKLGLDGRSFVMLLMGFGCNVPAIMGTRVIRSRGLRLLTMFTIPFSLCSARLQVFVFFTSMLFSPTQAPWVLFSLYLISMLTAMLSALLFQKAVQTREPFVLEMPPYRFPTLRQIAIKGWQEVSHFLHRASRFIVLGVVLVWALTHWPPGVEAASPESWAGVISRHLSFLTEPLGIDPQLSIALMFGFVAKEIVIGSLAVIYGSQGDALVQTIAHQMNWIQGYSFMLFTLIYTPCLSTIATLRTESKSWRFTLASLAWPLTLAWACSFVFYQVASRLG
jgi:ferrous iron transport protein B